MRRRAVRTPYVRAARRPPQLARSTSGSLTASAAGRRRIRQIRRLREAEKDPIAMRWREATTLLVCLYMLMPREEILLGR